MPSSSDPRYGRAMPTMWGTMEGKYVMKPVEGEVFEARIERFFLVAPDGE